MSGGLVQTGLLRGGLGLASSAIQQMFANAEEKYGPPSQGLVWTADPATAPWIHDSSGLEGYVIFSRLKGLVRDTTFSWRVITYGDIGSTPGVGTVGAAVYEIDDKSKEVRIVPDTSTWDDVVIGAAAGMLVVDRDSTRFALSKKKSYFGAVCESGSVGTFAIPGLGTSSTGLRSRLSGLRSRANGYSRATGFPPKLTFAEMARTLSCVGLVMGGDTLSLEVY